MSERPDYDEPLPDDAEIYPEEEEEDEDEEPLEKDV
ncbi:hypothetical protein DAPPPG734_08825 [Pantoea agglomerans]|uniref:Uncharacterized protein n=1 Tax=Enterobacter agglomerans TaxID=549 RepID=A0AAN2FEP6_ENTAG|nr:hypothetical protein DAPPPG734_08825 [Pantoea agglomerans]